MSSAFGGPRTVSRAPEKGVFPLDHFGECKKVKDKICMHVRGVHACKIHACVHCKHFQKHAAASR